MKKTLLHFIRFFISILNGHLPVNRTQFLSSIDSDQKILEIGPFCNPCMRGANVSYFDVLNKEELLKRAFIEKYIIDNPQDIPEINYVSPIGDLSIIKDKFDVVCSAHCIEHQPNLIKHLKDVSSLLNPGGYYYLIIPDKRYCFDALLDKSDIASIIEASRKNHSVHSLANVIRHFAMTTHNIPAKHWIFQHGQLENAVERTTQAIADYNKADGKYIDVHAWQFTPNSFTENMRILYEMNEIDLVVSSVHPTLFASNEFYVLLKKQ